MSEYYVILWIRSSKSIAPQGVFSKILLVCQGLPHYILLSKAGFGFEKCGFRTRKCNFLTAFWSINWIFRSGPNGLPEIVPFSKKPISKIQKAQPGHPPPPSIRGWEMDFKSAIQMIQKRAYIKNFALRGSWRRLLCCQKYLYYSGFQKFLFYYTFEFSNRLYELRKCK